MPLYSYKAYLESQKQTGLLFAQSPQEAVESLEEKNLLVLELKECAKKEQKRVSTATLLDFSQQLAQMLSAGLTLQQSLKEMESLHPIIACLRQEIEGGSSLSKAMQGYSCFDPLYCALIHAGEKTANLESSLLKGAELLQRKKRLSEKFVSALLYPAFLLFLSLFVLLGFFFFILPSFEDLFPKEQIQGMTKFLFAFSYFLRTHYWIYLPFVFLSMLLSFRFFKGCSKSVFILRLPLLGNFLKKAAFARFSSAMASLLEGGVSITAAIDLAKPVVGNWHLQKVIEEALESLVKGQYFSKALAKSSLIPKELPKFLEIGEKNGKMIEMFENLARIYEEDVQRLLERFEALIQPILLLFIASLIALVLISIMIPLSDLQTLSF